MQVCTPDNFCFDVEHGSSTGGRDKDLCKICRPQYFCSDVAHGSSAKGRNIRCCKVCRPDNFCFDVAHGSEGGTLKGHCKICKPENFCEPHGRLKSICVVCMSLDELLSKSLVCVVCCETKTKNEICKNCSELYNSLPKVRIEDKVKLYLEHFFEGIQTNYNKHIGGVYCKTHIDGSDECQFRTKGAYADIAMVLTDRVIFVEIDENYHRYYDASCELARFDTLNFGTDQFRPTFTIRFNPHDTAQVKVPLTERVKVLVQHIRNQLKCPVTDDKVSAYVSYLFYGTDTVHQKYAELAEMTLHVLPNINDASKVQLDDDVAKFDFMDLDQKEMDATTPVVLNQTQAKRSSPTTKRPRCSEPAETLKFIRVTFDEKQSASGFDGIQLLKVSHDKKRRDKINEKLLILKEIMPETRRIPCKKLQVLEYVNSRNSYPSSVAADAPLLLACQRNSRLSIQNLIN